MITIIQIAGVGVILFLIILCIVIHGNNCENIERCIALNNSQSAETPITLTKYHIIIKKNDIVYTIIDIDGWYPENQKFDPAHYLRNKTHVYNPLTETNINLQDKDYKLVSEHIVIFPVYDFVAEHFLLGCYPDSLIDKLITKQKRLNNSKEVI